MIVPLFALANIGIHVDGDLVRDAVGSPITLGIFFGYVVGKPLGILLGSRLAALLWPGRIPMALTWPVRVGGAVVCGIGFTVSLLVANLAFEGEQLEQAKVGVLAAAVVAALARVAGLQRDPPPARPRSAPASSRAPPRTSSTWPSEVDPARDHIRGPVDAPVTLLEYGDYECPYCSVAEVAIREVLGEFGDDVRYVWRHLPLNDVHRSAQMAAEAAEAAAAQDAFWPMHDLLISDPDELDPDDLDRYAEQLGLDRDRFWDEIRRHVHVGRVADDVASADAAASPGRRRSSSTAAGTRAPTMSTRLRTPSMPPASGRSWPPDEFPDPRRRARRDASALPRPAVREYPRDMRGVIGTARYWLPFVGGIVCLIAVQYVGAILGWILFFAAFGLILDGATKLWEKAGEHRQPHHLQAVAQPRDSGSVSPPS